MDDVNALDERIHLPDGRKKARSPRMHATFRCIHAISHRMNAIHG